MCVNVQGLSWPLSNNNNNNNKINFFLESCQRKPCALIHTVAKLPS